MVQEYRSGERRNPEKTNAGMQKSANAVVKGWCVQDIRVYLRCPQQVVFVTGNAVASLHRRLQEGEPPLIVTRTSAAVDLLL